MEPRVFSLVHDAHAAAAQFLQDAVVRDRAANHLEAVAGIEGDDTDEALDRQRYEIPRRLKQAT